MDDYEKDENSFASNPWSVDDATVFLKFCCPECDFQIPDLQMFSEHAIKNHSKSVALFGNVKDPEKIPIKKEDNEYEAENNFNESESQYDDFFSIKEENDSYMEEENIAPLEPVNENYESKPVEKIKAKTKSKPKFKDNFENMCDLCFESFDCPESLKNHRDVHQDGEFKICMHCNYRNKNWIHVKYHIDRHHPDHGEKQHFCELCGKGYIFKGTLQVHRKKSHSKEQNKQERVCHVCGFSTFSKDRIHRHILEKHEPEKHQKCPHCDYHTGYFSGIQSHIDGMHSELYDKNFDCCHCDKRFIFEHSLKKHLSKLQTRKQLLCKICGVQPMKLVDLLSHVKENHEGSMAESSGEKVTPLTIEKWGKKVVDQKVICDLCNAECEGQESLKKHKIEKHYDGKYKCCFYCDHKTPNMDNLRIHIDSNHPEHGEQKNLCDLCGRGFIFQVSCKRHKLQNHQRKSCHICGKEFFNNDTLKDHLISIHKTETLDLVCKYCPFTAKAKGRMKAHVAAKHKLENHKQCPYCEYHTHMIHRMHIHIDSKHPEHDKKKFSCDHCSRSFIFENSLKQHMNNITNGPKNWARKKMRKE